MERMSADYRNREYLSVGEVSAFTGIAVGDIHRMVRAGNIHAVKSTSGQYRFRLSEIRPLRREPKTRKKARGHEVAVNGTVQTLHLGDARQMQKCPDNSAHLAITSPPYFNAKMYSEAADGDIGNVHDLDEWLAQITLVWGEVFRVLRPGRKFFLNIMNLPVRVKQSFRSINLTGKSVEVCESIGFVFKRDIVWHKTNGVRAHFGTYPHPGGILLNQMHEFILEFEKPGPSSGKYDHVSEEQRERSKLDKEFWLSLKNSDVWLMKPEKSGGNREHVAPFPLELPTRLIRAYTFEGETVLDPFAGSGTALVAAAQWGRHGVGYEINPSFCKAATERIRNAEVLL